MNSNPTTNAARDAGHTPGPWATDIEVETFDGKILDCVVYQNHGTGKGNEICRFVHDPDDMLDVRDPETIANANLIANAPETKRQRDELITALQHCDRLAGCQGNSQDVSLAIGEIRSIARAAIARTERVA